MPRRAGTMGRTASTPGHATVLPNDFFTTTLIDLGDGAPPCEQEVLDRQRLERLRAQPLAEVGDLSVAIALAQLVHQEFLKSLRDRRVESHRRR